jgi:hypothetical protein
MDERKKNYRSQLKKQSKSDYFQLFKIKPDLKPIL